jgi:hypothetical protein
MQAEALKIALPGVILIIELSAAFSDLIFLDTAAAGTYNCIYTVCAWSRAGIYQEGREL